MICLFWTCFRELFYRNNLFSTIPWWSSCCTWAGRFFSLDLFQNLLQSLSLSLMYFEREEMLPNWFLSFCGFCYKRSGWARVSFIHAHCLYPYSTSTPCLPKSLLSAFDSWLYPPFNHQSACWFWCWKSGPACLPLQSYTVIGHY